MRAPYRSPVCLRRRSFRLSHAAGWLAVALAAAPLGGCETFGDVTGSIGGDAHQEPPTDEALLRVYADRWGKIYDQDPGEKVASINYARALRGLTRYTEEAAVTQAAAVKAPKDFEVLGAYGRALADTGELLQAKDVLSRAPIPLNVRIGRSCPSKARSTTASTITQARRGSIARRSRSRRTSLPS